MPHDSARRCEVVVLGAGPAGAAAAALLAQRGLEVTLIDRATFPRPKVCGCCLSARAQAALHEAGLADALRHARPLSRFTWHSGGRRVDLPLSGSVSLSRAALDHDLVRQAIARGCRFIDGCSARVGEIDGRYRLVHLPHGTLAASRVLVADGLHGSALADLPRFAPRVRPGSYVGLGTQLDMPLDPSAIVMAWGRGGYVGMVRLEDGSVNVAAALDPRLMRHAGPQRAVQQLLDDAGGDLHLPPANWHGTALLSRRRDVADHRLLVLGDAASYVEPFTGEGIAWALDSALAAVPLAALPWHDDIARQWRDTQRRLLGPGQRRCAGLTRLLRVPPLRHASMALLAHRPRLARPLLQRLHGSAQTHGEGAWT